MSHVFTSMEQTNVANVKKAQRKSIGERLPFGGRGFTWITIANGLIIIQNCLLTTHRYYTEVLEDLVTQPEFSV